MSAWSSVPDSGPGMPLPRPSALTRPHWDGCARGELLVQRCEDCGLYVFTPEAACTNCFSPRLAWVQSSGRGEVYSYTVVHRPQRPEFAVPYIVVIVALEEGWHMLSNLIDCPLDGVNVGDPVEVCFVPRGDIVFPMFRKRPVAR